MYIKVACSAFILEKDWINILSSFKFYGSKNFLLFYIKFEFQAFENIIYAGLIRSCVCIQAEKYLIN